MWRKSDTKLVREDSAQGLMRGRAPAAVRPGQARLLITTVFLVAALLPLWASSDKSKPAKTTEDLPAGAMQAKATTACLECHEARIILQQRLSKAAWTKEVDKMVKWGAVVDPADRDALIDYLSLNFNPDQPVYEAPRTVPSNAQVGTTKK